MMATSQHILVVGTIRNGAQTLSKELMQLQQALKNCPKVSFLIIESDSTDQTVAVLEQLKLTFPTLDYQSLGTLKETIPKRTARIAHCRNAYLQALETQVVYQDVDYVLMSDLDGMNTHLTPAGIASCWEMEDWAVCTANQMGLYYDLWALRHPLICPNDCWKVYEYLVKETGLSPSKARIKAVYSQMFDLPSHAKPIEVESAFGGLAIYRKETLLGLRYNGLDKSGNEFCEHISLHQQIRAKGGRIILNPQLINGKAPREHLQFGTPKKIVRYWIERLFPNFFEDSWYTRRKK